MLSTSKNKLKTEFRKICKDTLPDADTINLNTYKILNYIRFGDILGDEISAEDRLYDEILDYSKVLRKTEIYLEEFNTSSKKTMNLVLFEFAVDHVLRICRILKMPGGNALMIGLGGSGRQSLTRLSTFVCDYELFEI